MLIDKEVYKLALSEKQLKCIELLVKSDNISKVSKELGINRSTIYEWKKNKEFNAEMDKYVNDLKNGINKSLLSKAVPIVDKLIKIALESESDKTSLDACIYAINRLIGTPSSKNLDDTKLDDEEQGRIENKLTDLKIAK